MRKIVYYVASSIDGFISGLNDDISGFVGTGNGVDKYLADLANFDTVIMGRNTYEFGYKYGLQPGQPAYPHMKHYIFTDNLKLENLSTQVEVKNLDLTEIDKLKMHEGIDLGAPYGTPINAPADGIITFSGEKSGFGKFVQLDHGYGIETIYAHNQSLYVKSGQRIKRGTLLAAVGNTGHSTGPHLHYEVRVNGIAVDPLYFILD
jgi:hypothetical protein